MGCKFGSTLIDGTSFFNLTRCFRSLPHVVLGLDFQWSVSDLKIFACSEPTLGVLPLSVSSVPELVYALLKKHNSGWREAWGFFLLDDSIDLWVLFNALHGYTSLASFAIWGLPYGSGIFRIGVCHTTGIQGNGIPAPTLVLLKYRVPAYRGCWFTGKLGLNTFSWLSAQNRVSLLYKLSLYCGAFLAKSFDGNGSEAQRIKFCI